MPDEADTSLPPPGWFDDPRDPYRKRYWDGARWTDKRWPEPAGQPLPPPMFVGTAAPGWHPDPHDPDSVRYWDGTQWTEHRAPLRSSTRNSGGQAASTPFSADPAAVNGWVSVTYSTVPYLPAQSRISLTVLESGGLQIGSGQETIRVFGPGEWQLVSSESIPVPVRQTPLWAIILGLLLLCTIVGILFFFVKTNETVMRPGITVSTADGQFSGTR